MQELPTALSDWLVILPVIVPLLGAGLLLMLRRMRDYHWIVAVLIALAVLACDIELLRHALTAGPLAMTMGNWLPPFGISFVADATGSAFALVAVLVLLTALVYLQADRPSELTRDSLYPLLMVLLAGVSGAFLTGDLFNLYVWFEVMLIASFGLLVLGGRRRQVDAAVKYGFLNFIATTLFLLALGLLYGLTGTLNMADLVEHAAKAPAAAMTGIAALLLLAFGIKAAAFPVNAWLPASYHTPPAAISALMAGLLTKVGAYALLRTLVMLLPASRGLLEPLLALVAGATLLLGPLGAIAETNLRRALGFILIGGIGAIIAGIALADANGVAGAVGYIVHAMLTMAALYFVAGLIERTTGARDTRQMGGLYAANAPLSILFLLLVLAISGVPPFLGFWPKLLLLEGALDGAGIMSGALDGWALWLLACLLLNALLTLVAGTRLWSHIFWRAGLEGERSEIANPNLRPLGRAATWAGIGTTAVLTALVVALGLYPDPLLQLGYAAAHDLLEPASYIAATGIEGGTP